MIQNDTEGFTQLAMGEQPGDEKLLVRFSMMPVQDQNASTEAGRPIFRDTEMVEIRVPGERDFILQPATDHDRQRFWKQYERFKAGKGDEIVGTPLASVPWLTRSLVEEFAFFKIRSVEQLANLDDRVASKFPGAQGFKRRAQDFLDAAAGAAPAEKLRAELQKRDDQIAAMQAQLAQLVAEAAKPQHAAAKSK